MRAPKAWVRIALCAIVMACFLAPARSIAAYPEKPVRVVIPYGPGGSTDIITRIVFGKVQEILKAPFVVESKPGGNGIVAMQDVARSKPDGYTVFVGNNTTNSILPISHAGKLPLDIRKAFVPVTRLGSVAGMIVGTKVDFPPNTMREVIAYAKQHPGKLNCLVAAIGSYPHLAWLQIQKATGADFVIVPARTGMGGTITSILNGEIQFASIGVASALSLVQAGKIKALAATGKKRLPSLPDLPTLTEMGIPGEAFVNWQALFVPTGTPRDVIDKLYDAVKQAIAAPDIQARFKQQELLDDIDASPAAFADFLAEDAKLWERIVPLAGQAN